MDQQPIYKWEVEKIKPQKQSKVSSKAGSGSGLHLEEKELIQKGGRSRRTDDSPKVVEHYDEDSDKCLYNSREHDTEIIRKSGGI